MKELHSSWSDLAKDCLQIIMICGTIGIALKFVTFFNHWVYFPSFPNVLDSTFLILSVLYLTWNARKTPNIPLKQPHTTNTINISATKRSS